MSFIPWGLPPASDEATVRRQFEFILRNEGFESVGFATHIYCIVSAKLKPREITQEDFCQAFYGKRPKRTKKVKRNVIPFRRPAAMTDNTGGAA